MYAAVDDLSNGSDQMLSRLHIKKVMNADYSGWYKCWMYNSYGYTLPSPLVRFIPGRKCVSFRPVYWQTCGSNVFIKIINTVFYTVFFM